jgi:hypothetical protein
VGNLIHSGSVYTPVELQSSMISWLIHEAPPRITDSRPINPQYFTQIARMIDANKWLQLDHWNGMFIRNKTLSTQSHTNNNKANNGILRRARRKCRVAVGNYCLNNLQKPLVKFNERTPINKNIRQFWRIIASYVPRKE